MRLVLIALLLAGCSSWSHPTKTADAFEGDLYECEKDAAAVRDSTQAFYMKRRCLQVKGWKD